MQWQPKGTFSKCKFLQLTFTLWVFKRNLFEYLHFRLWMWGVLSLCVFVYTWVSMKQFFLSRYRGFSRLHMQAGNKRFYKMKFPFWLSLNGALHRKEEILGHWKVPTLAFRDWKDSVNPAKNTNYSQLVHKPKLQYWQTRSRISPTSKADTLGVDWDSEWPTLWDNGL